LLGELLGELLGTIAGLGLAMGDVVVGVADITVVGVAVGETLVVSIAGIEKLRLPVLELLQAVNKPVAIAINKIGILRIILINLSNHSAKQANQNVD
jgi:hypothetical protein